MVEILRLAGLALLLFALGYIAAITDAHAETVTIYNYSTGEYSFIYVPDNDEGMNNVFDYSTETWYGYDGDGRQSYEDDSNSRYGDEGSITFPSRTYGDPY